MYEPVMSVEQLEEFLDEAFPQMQGEGPKLTTIERVGPGEAECRLAFDERNLRPGGTISGPAMMALADHAMYVLVLAHIGPVALAVTTNLSINFLRKPGKQAITAQAKLLKLGKQLAVADIALFSDGENEPVAHAVSTYSIPPRMANVVSGYRMRNTLKD